MLLDSWRGRGARAANARRLLLACVLMPLTAMAEKAPFTQTGMASWYGNEFKGHKTASGTRYNPEELTAAHRKLPFGTCVRVTNLRNNRSTVVKITNRGPYIHRRIIDVSRKAARELDMMKSGVARVRIVVVPKEEEAQKKPGNETTPKRGWFPFSFVPIGLPP